MKGPNPLQTREAWVLCFLLGIVMINYPFIHIFNKATLVLGIPTLFLYFFVGWPVSILVIYLFCRTLRDENGQGTDKGSGRKGQK